VCALGVCWVCVCAAGRSLVGHNPYAHPQSVLGRVWNVVSQARRQQPGEAHKEAVTPPHAKTKPATRPASQYGGLPTAAGGGGGGGGWAVPHWTDRALGQPGVTDDDVQDVRQLLSVLWLMLPLPPFWTLYDQTGSRWTLQARRMDLLLFNGTLAGSGRCVRLQRTIALCVRQWGRSSEL
jgi:hypothetical protein